MTSICNTISTTNDLSKAKEIISLLIQKKLIACGQIDEIESIYFWNNEIQNEKEFRMMLKHPIGLKKELVKELIKVHNYENPEIISFHVETTRKYMDWCIDSCK